MSEYKAIILAAGKGTRMRSDLPKVLHEIEGKPLVEYVTDAVKEAGAKDICLVVGYKREEVQEKMKDAGVVFAVQTEQLGTGHAVKCAKDFLDGKGSVFILCGDTPLVTGKTLRALADFHEKNQNAVTVLSTRIEDPTGYGRIIRDADGAFVKSVEHKDATPEELASKEINSGMYLFDAAKLAGALDLLTTDNAQGEYYLPDTLTIIREAGGRVDAYVTEDASEIAGVNTKEQLADAAAVIASRK